MLYNPNRDLYVVLGVPAGAFHAEVRRAIVRQYASLAVQDLAEASRLLLSPTRRALYDLHRTAHRVWLLACRLWPRLRGAPRRRVRRGVAGWWRSTPTGGAGGRMRQLKQRRR
jgi:hypothetical protein